MSRFVYKELKFLHKLDLCMYIFMYAGPHLHLDIEVRTDLMKEHNPSPQCWVLAPKMLEFWCSHELRILLQ